MGILTPLTSLMADVGAGEASLLTWAEVGVGAEVEASGKLPLSGEVGVAPETPGTPEAPPDLLPDPISEADLVQKTEQEDLVVVMTDVVDMTLVLVLVLVEVHATFVDLWITGLRNSQMLCRLAMSGLLMMYLILGPIPLSL